MNYKEKALDFPSNDVSLFGVLCVPDQTEKRGILFVVGGAQYRTGSHRQFTLLSRQFATQGIPVMRFDHSGMGDSEGTLENFSNLDGDIHAAIDCFFQQVPELNEVILWGLCDAASAAIFYARHDHRVSGLVLLNPWVRTDQGMAKIYLKHYYFPRLFKYDFWTKIFTGKFSFFTTLTSFIQQISTIKIRKNKISFDGDINANNRIVSSLPEKVYESLRNFQGRSLLILCSNDLTAKEFSDLAESSSEWKKLMSSPKISRMDLEGANHTFSQRRWREKIGQRTIDWVKTQ